MPVKVEKKPMIEEYTYVKEENGGQVKYLDCEQVRMDYECCRPDLEPLYELCKNNGFKDVKL